MPDGNYNVTVGYDSTYHLQYHLGRRLYSIRYHHPNATYSFVSLLSLQRIVRMTDQKRVEQEDYLVHVVVQVVPYDYLDFQILQEYLVKDGNEVQGLLYTTTGRSSKVLLDVPAEDLADEKETSPLLGNQRGEGEEKKNATRESKENDAESSSIEETMEGHSCIIPLEDSIQEEVAENPVSTKEAYTEKNIVGDDTDESILSRGKIIEEDLLFDLITPIENDTFTEKIIKENICKREDLITKKRPLDPQEDGIILKAYEGTEKEQLEAEQAQTIVDDQEDHDTLSAKDEATEEEHHFQNERIKKELFPQNEEREQVDKEEIEPDAGQTNLRRIFEPQPDASSKDDPWSKAKQKDVPFEESWVENGPSLSGGKYSTESRIRSQGDRSRQIPELLRSMDEVNREEEEETYREHSDGECRAASQAKSSPSTRSMKSKPWDEDLKLHILGSSFRRRDRGPGGGDAKCVSITSYDSLFPEKSLNNRGSRMRNPQNTLNAKKAQQDKNQTEVENWKAQLKAKRQSWHGDEKTLYTNQKTETREVDPRREIEFKDRRMGEPLADVKEEAQVIAQSLIAAADERLKAKRMSPIKTTAFGTSNSTHSSPTVESPHDWKFPFTPDTLLTTGTDGSKGFVFTQSGSSLTDIELEKRGTGTHVTVDDFLPRKVLFSPLPETKEFKPNLTRRAAVKIQSWIRMRMIATEYTHFRDFHKRTHRSCCTIQKSYRVHMQKRLQAQQKTEDLRQMLKESSAAMVIQRSFRKKRNSRILAAKRFLKLYDEWLKDPENDEALNKAQRVYLKPIIVIQRTYRLHRLRETTKTRKSRHKKREGMASSKKTRKAKPARNVSWKPTPGFDSFTGISSPKKAQQRKLEL